VVVATAQAIPGDVVQHARPCWEPLVTALGCELAKWFMWMFEVELADETRLHVYKHVTTRRVLHLDATGRAFKHDVDGRYREMAVTTAIARVCMGWECAAASGEYADPLRAAMRRARLT
jgi:hypothetical protein